MNILRRIKRPFQRSATSRPVEQKNARAKVGEIVDILDSDSEIVRAVRPYTLTSELRIESLLQSVRHCIQRDIPGAFVECGVWKGGSILAMILQLQVLGVSNRDLYLYDTFEGMTEPTEEDTSAFEAPALETWAAANKVGATAWSRFFSQDVFDEAGVRALLEESGYPQKHIHFVRGPVEETIPDISPAEVALLRLDTDWYGSTKHELEHLYPRIARGGVLIIDDYGHWDGARKAVEEYFASKADPILLSRIDYTGRIGLKI